MYLQNSPGNWIPMLYSGIKKITVFENDQLLMFTGSKFFSFSLHGALHFFLLKLWEHAFVISFESMVWEIFMCFRHCILHLCSFHGPSGIFLEVLCLIPACQGLSKHCPCRFHSSLPREGLECGTSQELPAFCFSKAEEKPWASAQAPGHEAGSYSKPQVWRFFL